MNNQITNPLKSRKYVVENHPKGKKPISWRKDPLILARLAAVNEIILRGGTTVSVSKTLDYSLATAKRDISRVKTLWCENSLQNIKDMQNHSIAQYKLVQTKAWSEYSKNPSAHWLRVIIEAQSRIDNLQGILAPKEVSVEVREPDMEAIRKKRWEDVKDTLTSILTED